MKTILKPEDELQPSFFVDDELGWWAAKLSPNALKRLHKGWQGVFRRSILKLMPAEELGGHFSPDAGRPTKELHSMAGLLLIAEFKNLTGDQTAEAYTFDASVQFALNLPRDGQYLSPRTVDNYRKLFREDDLAQRVFTEVSAALVAELEIDIRRQRLDSTHVLGDMARLGRRQLLSVTVRRFLVALEKHHPEVRAGLCSELLERYRPAETRLFGGGRDKGTKTTEIILQIGADIAALIAAFHANPGVSAMESYLAMVRIFAEHFETAPTPEPAPPVPRPKSIDASGGSTRTLQNPSDPDAGYDGKKGAGYQAQIAQTLPPRDADGETEGPGLLTALIPQSAAVRDNDALAGVLEIQTAHGLAPHELTADTIYGSDANVLHCASLGIELISPVGGPKPGANPPINHWTRAEREKRARLDGRRELEETDEWKDRYATRAGIEGVNRALDLVTGFKRLRVRGLAAVGMALHLKGAGWNILAASKILARRARKAAQAAVAAGETRRGHPTSGECAESLLERARRNSGPNRKLRIVILAPRIIPFANAAKAA